MYLAFSFASVIGGGFEELSHDHGIWGKTLFALLIIFMIMHVVYLTVAVMPVKIKVLMFNNYHSVTTFTNIIITVMMFVSGIYSLLFLNMKSLMNCLEYYEFDYGLPQMFLFAFYFYLYLLEKGCVSRKNLLYVFGGAYLAFCSVAYFEASIDYSIPIIILSLSILPFMILESFTSASGIIYYSVENKDVEAENSTKVNRKLCRVFAIEHEDDIWCFYKDNDSNLYYYGKYDSDEPLKLFDSKHSTFIT